MIAVAPMKKTIEYTYEEDNTGAMECHAHALDMVFTYVEPTSEDSDSPEFWATGDHHVFHTPHKN